MTKKEKKQFNIYIGARLRMGRKLRRCSQEQLGKGIPSNITYQQVQKYESAINRISVDMLQECADFLELPITYFFPDPTHDFQEPILSKIEMELLECFHAMRPQSQAALMALLKGATRAI